MKIKNVVTALVFALAMGSAIASDVLLPQVAYSKKADVPGQEADCQERGICEGGTIDCSLSFDPDGSGPLAPIVRPMYQGIGTTCGARLKQP